MKNIRRCLKAPKADPTPLVSTAVASVTAIATSIKGAFPMPTVSSGWGIAWWLTWIVVPVLLAGASVAVAYMRYANAVAAQDNEHLKAAQEDADNLIAMQASAQDALNRKLAADLAAAATQHARLTE